MDSQRYALKSVEFATALFLFGHSSKSVKLLRVKYRTRASMQNVELPFSIYFQFGKHLFYVQTVAVCLHFLCALDGANLCK